MAEDYELCTFQKHHKQKILLFLSAMRSYADNLKKNKYKIEYKKIEDNDFKKKEMVASTLQWLTLTPPPPPPPPPPKHVGDNMLSIIVTLESVFMWQEKYCLNLL